MQQIPLAAVPNQTLNVVLNGQAVSLALYTIAINSDYVLFNLPNLDGDPGAYNAVFMDITFGSTVIKTCVRGVNLARMLADCQYTAFVGDFVFVDTQGTTDPTYTGLGSRYQLIYLEAADLAASVLG